LPVAQFFATVSAAPGSSPAPANVEFIGPVPDAVAGSVQLRVRVPDSAQPGKSILSAGQTLGGSRPGPSAIAQNIYMLSDPPVLTDLSPASPIPQTLGNGVYLTLTGEHMERLVKFNFYMGGNPIDLHAASFTNSTSTSCTVFV